MPGPEADAAAYEDLAVMIEREMRPNLNAVIVADDVEAIRQRIVTGVLRMDPTITPYEAKTGRDVLDKLAEIRRELHRDPLVIILDLQMPVMDGWEVIAHLKREYERAGRSAGIPLIVISGGSGEKRGGAGGPKSVHVRDLRYHPMITVAKDHCVRVAHYDAVGERSVLAWLEFLVRGSRSDSGTRRRGAAG